MHKGMPVLVIGPSISVLVGHDAPLILAFGIIYALLLRVGRVRGGPALVAALSVIEARLLAGKGKRGVKRHEKQGEGGLYSHAPVYHVPTPIATVLPVLVISPIPPGFAGVSDFLAGKQKSRCPDAYKEFKSWLECKSILSPESARRGVKIDLTQSHVGSQAE